MKKSKELLVVSCKHPNHHMRTRLRLDPSRLRRHDNFCISYLEDNINLRLFYEEHDLIFNNIGFLDNSRHIFQFLESLWTIKLIKDLLLQSKSINFL